MKRPNPYPGITRVIDRHGKPRWRFRMKGRPSCYIHGEFGSRDFEKAYLAARDGTIAIAAAEQTGPGSMAWVVGQYLATPEFAKIGPLYKRNLRLELERFVREYGEYDIRDLRPHYVEAMLARISATPAAANKLLKLIRRLARFSIKRGWIAADPSQGVKGYATNPDGYHTWSDAEIAQFEAHHGSASKAVLAMRLMLYTGAARQDAAAMGWQNVRGDRIEYRRHKTGGFVSLPLGLLPELREVLAPIPREQMLFITHGGGRPYNPATFGSWFKDQCRAAGLSHCSAHGLRKAGATRLADAGATEFEIMAFLGHRSPNEARTYVKAANRAKLADSAFEKLRVASTRVERLDNRRRKSLKGKDK